MTMFVLLGQFIIGLVFVIAVFSDLRDRKILINLLNTKKVPFPVFLFYGAIILKLVCGVALIINYWAPIAAFFLAGFTLIANVLLHNFWDMRGTERKNEFLVFLIHMAIVGGLVVVMGT